MKKLLIIPVMFLYILAVSGVLINAHYCGTELASWSMYQSTDGCGDEDECESGKLVVHSCCKDKVIAAKVSEDQKQVDAFKLKLSAPDAIVPASSFTVVFTAPAIGGAHKSVTNLPNAPPGLWQNIPLYKLHASFTYYG